MGIPMVFRRRLWIRHDGRSSPYHGLKSGIINMVIV